MTGKGVERGGKRRSKHWLVPLCLSVHWDTYRAPPVGHLSDKCLSYAVTPWTPTFLSVLSVMLRVLSLSLSFTRSANASLSSMSCCRSRSSFSHSSSSSSSFLAAVLRSLWSEALLNYKKNPHQTTASTYHSKLLLI